MLTLVRNEPQPLTVQFTPVKSAELHRWWPFLERGLKDIRRKVRPDWIEADIFGAIRAEAAFAVIASRAGRDLGFIVWHRQERPFSHTLDIFVWAVWTLPLRERIPSDNFPEAIQKGKEYLEGVKRQLGASKVITISRKGFQRAYGWRPIYLTYEV